MNDLYKTDTVAWAREQATLLRRVAAGERVNDQVDWGNVIEEIESVGRSEVRAVTSALQNAMQHKPYVSTLRRHTRWTASSRAPGSPG